MSSGPVFPPHSGSIDPEQLCGDASAGMVSAEWYTPSSYPFNDSYGTPYPTTTIEGHHPSWNAYARASAPDLSIATYLTQHQQQQQQPPPPPPQSSSSHTSQVSRTPAQSAQSQLQSQQHPTPHSQQTSQIRDVDRPRSSPSSFNPPSDSVPWLGNPLGITYSSAETTPATAAYPPGVFQNSRPEHDQYSNPVEAKIRQPTPLRPYTSIAPNPAGMEKRKRSVDDQQKPLQSHDGSGSSGATPKSKRKRSTSVVSAELSDEDRFLLQLKEEESLPWKEIASRFQTEKGRNFQVAALQMRYKRLRERFRPWEDRDVQALKLAHEYWEKYKWEIIASKMLDFDVLEKWPSRHCARKWQDLDAANAGHGTANPLNNPGMTPVSLSQFSSPIDGPVHFAFMPLQ